MVRRHQQYVAVTGFIIILLLAGCGSRSGDAAPPQETVPIVQQAVDRYVLTHHTPPVKQRTGEAGEYERYPIDFRQLVQTLQLAQVPSNAYENGGAYYYVLQPSSEGWQVKLIDMVLWQNVTDIQAKASTYIAQTGRLPAADSLREGIYKIDAKALGLDSDQVRSVYSPQMLPLLITDSGTVVIDYAFEIMKRVQMLAETFQPTIKDLREILMDGSFMLPVHSLPYRWENDEPVITLP